MSYRGFGGFGTIYARPRSRPAAGDLSDISIDDPGSADESAGLDTSSTPDFSDVTGGSSSTADYTTMGLGALDSGLGSITKLFGGGGALAPALGSAAAAGVAAARSPRVRRAMRAFMGGGRRHRMNPGNFKALRRSMHRLAAFEKAAKRVLHFTHPSKTARVKWKFPRRRRKR